MHPCGQSPPRLHRAQRRLSPPLPLAQGPLRQLCGLANAPMREARSSRYPGFAGCGIGRWRARTTRLPGSYAPRRNPLLHDPRRGVGLLPAPRENARGRAAVNPAGAIPCPVRRGGRRSARHSRRAHEIHPVPEVQAPPRLPDYTPERDATSSRACVDARTQPEPAPPSP